MLPGHVGSLCLVTYFTSGILLLLRDVWFGKLPAGCNTLGYHAIGWMDIMLLGGYSVSRLW